MAELKKFIVAGTIQGHGMDADKFYEVAWTYYAEDEEDARAQAEVVMVRIEKVIDGEVE